MRNVFKGIALALSASFIVACGGGGSPMEAGLQHQKAMLKIVEANKTDAAKAATELEAYLKANGDDIKAQKAALAKAKADPANNDITKMGEASLKTRSEVSTLTIALAKDAQSVLSDPKVAELLSAAE